MGRTDAKAPSIPQIWKILHPISSVIGDTGAKIGGNGISPDGLELKTGIRHLSYPLWADQAIAISFCSYANCAQKPVR
ncbi:MAG: hypothetical protein AAF827_05925 [Cyanobacteria bacterium P01_D01_bin.6]